MYLVKQNKVELIAENAQAILTQTGMRLADLELVKEGANWFLRFFIEHADEVKPVDLEDCQKASEMLSQWLDEADPLPQAYFLEVSSPGIERPLKSEADFVRFKGKMVVVHTYKLFMKKKKHIGQLGPVTDEELILIYSEGEMQIPRNLISNVHLHSELKVEV